MNKFLSILVLTILLSCSNDTKQHEEKIKTLEKPRDIVEVIVRDSITNEIVQSFKTINDTIYGRVKDYSYHNNGSLRKEILYDSLWNVLGYASEYDSLGSLISKKSYWFFPSKNKNVVNDYIFFDTLGSIDREKSSYIELFPRKDTIARDTDLQRSYSIFFNNSYQIDSVKVYLDSKWRFKNHENFIIKTNEITNFNFEIEHNLFSDKKEFYLAFKIFYKNSNTDNGIRTIWKRFFLS